jgi:CopG family transcriptional regulator / antitoxin EndoAI
MRTIQMTLENELVEAVDRAVRRQRTSRSAFTRDALRDALRRIQTRDLERKQARGYARKPVRKREFSGWEKEQAWGDD